MTAFNWAGLAARIRDMQSYNQAAAAYLRERIEAAFVPVERYHEADKARIALLNLLAVIHRDGGHKTHEIGWRMAAVQAERISAERIKATARAEAAEARLREWQECALYDATMDGPVFKGWDRSALDRCRRHRRNLGGGLG